MKPDTIEKLQSTDTDLVTARLKSMAFQAMKGRAQPRADRKPILAFTREMEAKLTEIKRNPNQVKATPSKKQQSKKKGPVSVQ